MPEWQKNLIRQFGALEPARKATLVATAAGSLAFFLWLSVGAQSEDYRLLFRGLEDAEIAQVVDALTAERIDYHFAEGGSASDGPRAPVLDAETLDLIAAFQKIEDDSLRKSLLNTVWAAASAFESKQGED